MVNDTDIFQTNSVNEPLAVQLVRWICPICGTVVDTKMTKKAFDSLSIDELRKIMDKLTDKDVARVHNCKMIPIYFVERGMMLDGIYKIRKGNN